MSRLYTSKDEVEKYLLTNIKASFNTQIDSWIESASKHVEQVTNRWFIATEPQERYFDGKGGRTLEIDDAVQIDKVEEGSNFYGDSFNEVSEANGSRGYIKLPRDASEREVPYEQLYFRSGIWISGIQNHRVTAKWGYSTEPPEDITFATTVFVAGMINTAHKIKDDIQRESIGNYQVTYADKSQISDYQTAKSILGHYKKHYL